MFGFCFCKSSEIYKRTRSLQDEIEYKPLFVLMSLILQNVPGFWLWWIKRIKTAKIIIMLTKSLLLWRGRMDFLSHSLEWKRERELIVCFLSLLLSSIDPHFPSFFLVCTNISSSFSPMVVQMSTTPVRTDLSAGCGGAPIVWNIWAHSSLTLYLFCFLVREGCKITSHGFSPFFVKNRPKNSVFFGEIVFPSVR